MRRRRKHASRARHNDRLTRALEARRHRKQPNAAQVITKPVEAVENSLSGEEDCKHIAILQYCVELLAEREKTDKALSSVWEFKREIAEDLLRLWCITTGKQTYVIYELSESERELVRDSHPLLSADLGTPFTHDSPEAAEWHRQMKVRVHAFCEKLKDLED